MLFVMARPYSNRRRERLRINQVSHGFEAPKDWLDTVFPIHERFESMGLTRRSAQVRSRKDQKRAEGAARGSVAVKFVAALP